MKQDRENQLLADTSESSWIVLISLGQPKEKASVSGMACLQLERIGLMVGRRNKELQCYKKIMKGYVHTSTIRQQISVCENNRYCSSTNTYICHLIRLLVSMVIYCSALMRQHFARTAQIRRCSVFYFRHNLARIEEATQW